MKKILTRSAITKMQILAIIALIFIGAIGAAYFIKSPTSSTTPITTTKTTTTTTTSVTTTITTTTSTATTNNTTIPEGGKEIVVGLEYVVPGFGETFEDLNISAVKPLPEQFSWDKMQKGSESPIDFSSTDKIVKEYQDSGFTNIVLSLKTSGTSLISPWMIAKEYPKTQAVDPQYYSHYSRWVTSLVERYDKDGVADMPGLRYPIKYYEIGVEFSSYQPEPTEVYLKTLELGYKAAHQAYDGVFVGHSAFLVTPVFKDNPSADEYEKAFAKNLVGTDGKGLKDIRMILDKPDLFDFLNVHNLGWPYEIEQIVKWLKYETSLRGYSKPIIVSDTTPTSFAGLGSATKCEGNNLAVIFPPATETDRCRLAEYFKNLINNKTEYIKWLRNFLAGDIVQRVVVAAEQKIELIDTSFTSDIPGANLAIFQAAAGNSGWGGLIDYQGGHVTGKRPAYYSLQQLQANIRGYDSIVRVDTEGDVRMYRILKEGKEFFIVWYGYQKLYLPEDEMPTKNIQIDVGASTVTIEEMKTSPNVVRRPVETDKGILSLMITPEPIYIFKD